jgi:hypothetical protein
MDSGRSGWAREWKGERASGRRGRTAKGGSTGPLGDWATGHGGGLAERALNPLPRYVASTARLWGEVPPRTFCYGEVPPADSPSHIDRRAIHTILSLSSFICLIAIGNAALLTLPLPIRRAHCPPAEGRAARLRAILRALRPALHCALSAPVRYRTPLQENPQWQ